MTTPLSPHQIRALDDAALSITAKLTRARANQKQSEAAEWQRCAGWCEREVKRRKRRPA
jgi:hypothetical protein